MSCNPHFKIYFPHFHLISQEYIHTYMHINRILGLPILRAVSGAKWRSALHGFLCQVNYKNHDPTQHFSSLFFFGGGLSNKEQKNICTHTYTYTFLNFKNKLSQFFFLPPLFFYLQLQLMWTGFPSSDSCVWCEIDCKVLRFCDDGKETFYSEVKDSLQGKVLLEKWILSFNNCYNKGKRTPPLLFFLTRSLTPPVLRLSKMTRF